MISTRAQGRVREAGEKVAEEAIHVAIKEWLEAVLPNAIVIHVPNAPRSKIAGARLKRMGMIAGWPDLTVMVGDGAKTFCLEVKVARGSLSKDQRAVHDMLAAKRIPVATVRSIDEARAFVSGLGITTRERV
jgi:hypothetical protein